MPENLKNVVFSEYYGDILWRVCENQHLSEEKIKKIATLVGYVVVGFLLPDDLAQEIKDHLGINPELAKTISGEIDKKILEPIKNDVVNVYSPSTEATELISGTKKAETGLEVITLGTIGQEKETLPKVTIKPGGQELPTEGKPLIIHQEETLTEERKEPFKGLEPPFGFFGKEGEAAPSEPVKVKVEGLGEKPAAAKAKAGKEEKRVVHYSELRTPLTPFQKQEEIINLETFGRKPPEVKAPMPETKPQPKIEGNIVDLSE